MVPLPIGAHQIPEFQKVCRVVLPENSYHTLSSHQLLEIVLPFQGLVVAPTATQDYPFPATDAKVKNIR